MIGTEHAKWTKVYQKVYPANSVYVKGSGSTQEWKKLYLDIKIGTTQEMTVELGLEDK